MCLGVVSFYWKIVNKQLTNVNKFLKKEKNWQLSNSFWLYLHRVRNAFFQSYWQNKFQNDLGHPVQHPYVYFLFLSESFKAHDDQLIALEKKNKELKNKVEETTLMAEINGLKELVNGKFSSWHIFCHRDTDIGVHGFWGRGSMPQPSQEPALIVWLKCFLRFPNTLLDFLFILVNSGFNNQIFLM